MKKNFKREVLLKEMGKYNLKGWEQEKDLSRSSIQTPRFTEQQ